MNNFIYYFCVGGISYPHSSHYDIICFIFDKGKKSISIEDKIIKLSYKNESLSYFEKEYGKKTKLTKAVIHKYYL